MIKGPYEHYCDELDELCNRWIDKPEDDQLTIGELVGGLEAKKFFLLSRAEAMLNKDDSDD